MQFNRIIIQTGFIFFIVFGLFSCQSKQTNTENTNTTPAKINVGVFNGNGASAVCVLETLEALKLDSGISPQAVSAVDIMRGALNNLDVIIFPGGSGSKELNNMGQQAADKVRAFGQQANKGIVGICAGGYLLASTPGYPNLGIVPITHIREHYDRGRGLISISQNEMGNKLFPENAPFDSIYVQYYDGPIFNISDTSQVQVLATVNTDITPNKGDPFGVTPGRAAILSYNYGQGKVFIIIGHPEATHGMRWMVPRMARLSINKTPIEYNPLVVRPDAYNKELMFIPELKKFEKAQFWKLSDKDPYSIQMALEHLKNLHSRPSIRWSIGLLRHSNASVRLAAAKYLVFTEYTAALPDLMQAALDEKNPETKTKLDSLYQQLNSYIR